MHRENILSLCLVIEVKMLQVTPRVSCFEIGDLRELRGPDGPRLRGQNKMGMGQVATYINMNYNTQSKTNPIQPM